MAVGNSLANRQQKTGLTAYLTNDAVKNQINNVVGGKNGDRFIASIVSAVQVNSDLQECTNPSILSAALLGGSDGQPMFKLVEADGGLWKYEAVDAIKKYLTENLPKELLKVITIIG